MRRLLHRIRSDEGGFTMAELAVYVSVAVLVLGIIGNILIQSLTVSRDVRTTAEATTLAQTIVSGITVGVRESTELTWSGSAPGNELLVSKTLNAAGTVSCDYREWFYEVGTGAIYFRTSSTTPTAVGTVTANDLTANWTLLGEGIYKVSPNLVFAKNGLNVAVTFKVDAGEESPVLIDTTVISRGTTLESYQCS